MALSISMPKGILGVGNVEMMKVVAPVLYEGKGMFNLKKR